MGKITESNNILTVDLDEKYIRNIIVNLMDDLFIGAINYLRDIGKSCEFFGFNVLNGHVVLIDGIKYCTSGIQIYDGFSFPTEEFYIVEDLDYDYRENRLKDRANKILDILGDKRI